jgi:hypothetical protein
VTRAYRQVVDAWPASSSASHPFDGEMAVQDEAGITDFHALRSRASDG